MAAGGGRRAVTAALLHRDGTPVVAADGEGCGAAGDDPGSSGHRGPRLIAVPDCEPPLEPLPADPDAVDPAGPGRITFAASPALHSLASFRVVDAERVAANAGAPDRARPDGDAASAGASTTRAATRIMHRRCAPPGSLVGTPVTARTSATRPVRAPRRVFPLLIESQGVPGWSTDTEVGIRPTATAALPPAIDAGTALARGLLEALSGRRTVAQLRTHCAPRVFAGLERVEPLRDPQLRLLSIWACEPADGVAEISAAFRCGARTRALALRLEGVDGRWRVTALQLG